MHRGDAEDAEIISLRFGGLNGSESSHPKVEHSPRTSAMNLHVKINAVPSELARRIGEARLARGISLEEAERATKIRRRYLEAIEAGDFAQLPDGPPGRGFVRNYARYLGLDPEAAIHLLEAEVGVPIVMLQDPAPPPPIRQRQISKYTQLALPEPQMPASNDGDDEPMNGEVSSDAVVRQNGANERMVVSLARPPRAIRSSFRLKEIRGPFTRYDPHMLTARGAKQPFSALPRTTSAARYGLGAAFVIAILLLIVLVLARSQMGASLLGSSQPPPTFVPQVTIFAPLPTTANQSASPPAQSAPEGAAGELRLALDARERAWVRVRVDGSIVFEGIPAPGPGLPFSARREITVETGDAGAFEVILNDARLGPLGARNETVRRTWNATAP
jgi:transcriptional regulator with XRE-family HTH domain